MGVSYKGGTFTYHSLSDNIDKVKHDFQCSEAGNFGRRTRNNGTREYPCSDPVKTAEKFYDEIAYGGVEKVTQTKDGKHERKTVYLKDGTIINYREISTSGPPAVEVNIKKSTESCGIKQQKIHFIKE